jgi:hypothetical protein
MSSFQAGDTFLIITDPNDTKMHLHIVICGPAGNPPTILAVQLNTWTSLADPTVILEVGDHSFVTRKTFVNYGRMSELQVDPLLKLEALRSEAYFQRHARCNTDLLERIVQGALQSDRTPGGMVKALKNRLGLAD